MWQANFVKDRLEALYPELQVELVPMSTQGDKILDTPLAKVGGKGLFVKELETAMLEGRADIAVHSMKDVPVEFPEGLGLHTICEREDPRDAFVSNRFTAIDELPQGAVVGTSSLRRQCQLRAARPDLVIRDLRGNVNTRLAKLDAGEYDAIILAAAGLKRLEMAHRITAFIEPEQSLPANGQGAVGIECRLDDHELHALLAPLEHPETRIRVLTERAMNRALQGLSGPYRGLRPGRGRGSVAARPGGQPGWQPRHPRRDPRPAGRRRGPRPHPGPAPAGRWCRCHPGRGLPGMSAGRVEAWPACRNQP